MDDFFDRDTAGERLAARGADCGACADGAAGAGGKSASVCGGGSSPRAPSRAGVLRDDFGLDELSFRPPRGGFDFSGNSPRSRNHLTAAACLFAGERPASRSISANTPPDVPLSKQYQLPPPSVPGRPIFSDPFRPYRHSAGPFVFGSPIRCKATSGRRPAQSMEGCRALT